MRIVHAMTALVLSGCCGPIQVTALSDDSGSGAVDEDSGASGGVDTDGEDLCEDVPTLTWNNFGNGFMLENCQGCHASTAANRYGAPEGVYFDTVDDTWTHASRILTIATGDDPSMPPQGGVLEDDRTKLSWWLSCAEPGT